MQKKIEFLYTSLKTDYSNIEKKRQHTWLY